MSRAWRVSLAVVVGAVGLLLLGSSSASAHEARALAGPCPAYVSICNPVGEAVLAYEASVDAGTLGTTVVTGAAASTTAGVTWASAISTGGALIVGSVAIWEGGKLIFEPGAVAAAGWVTGQGTPAGWLDDVNCRMLGGQNVCCSASPQSYAVNQASTLTCSKASTENMLDANIYATARSSTGGGSQYYIDTGYPGWSTGTRTVTRGANPDDGLVEWILGSGTSVQWWAFGAPGAPSPRGAGTPAGQGTLVRAIDCANATGSTHWESDAVVNVTGLYQEVAFPPLGCPAGSIMTHFSGSWQGPGVSPVEFTAGDTSTWVRDIPTEYPDCLTGECVVSLWSWDVPRGQWDWCGSGALGCARWTMDVNRESDYQCRFGTYAVGLEWCSSLRFAGAVVGNVLTTTAVGPNGTLVPVLDTPTLPDPSAPPGSAGNPYPPEYPNGDPTVDPTLPDSPGGGECFPSGWGLFNPVEWVLRPTKCALSWAFVPRWDVVRPEFDDSMAGFCARRPWSTACALGGVDWTGGDACTGGLSSSFTDVSAGLPELRLGCAPAGDGYAPVREVVQWYIIIVGLLGAWVMVTSALGSGGGEV